MWISRALGHGIGVSRMRWLIVTFATVVAWAAAVLGPTPAAWAGETSQFPIGAQVRSQTLADVGANPFGTVGDGRVIWDDPDLGSTELETARLFGRLEPLGSLTGP